MASDMNTQSDIKIGIAGMGAMGRAVARALLSGGVPGYVLAAASDLTPASGFDIPFVDFNELAVRCELIVECLPASAVPALMQAAVDKKRDVVLISSAALLLFPEILDQKPTNSGRIIVPSGAIAGLDGVQALAQSGIISSRIASTKKPAGYAGAPFIQKQSIDLSLIKKRTNLFTGNALEAARAFPANVNVAASLSLCGAGPVQTQVEIWADPEATGNTHEIWAEGKNSKIYTKVENMPDPENPKTSMLAAQSILSVLKKLNQPMVIL